MTATKEHDLERCAEGGPQSAMERRFLEEFLETKGQSLASLKSLPEEKVHQLMTEACRYASLKLAEVECKAHFRESIHRPD